MQTYAASRLQTTTIPQKLPLATVHAVFEAWADCFPEATAVVAENVHVSYAELEQSANRVAHALRSSGVKRGELVAVLRERGTDLIAALLGILKVGAAFAALDPRLPKEARIQALDAVGCRFMLTCRSSADSLPLSSVQVLHMDEPGWLGDQPDTRPEPLSGLDDPACVLFTSGSTGQPKAVLYLHRNLANRFSNTVQLSRFDRSSIFAQSSPISSIDAIDEILVPLVSGGCTVILPSETVTDPHRLVDILSAYDVTHMLLVPSLLRVILAAGEDLGNRLDALKTWLIGGEPLTGALARDFHKKLPAAKLINFYGLTEGDGIFHITSPQAEYGAGVPIGYPVQGTRVYLVNESMDWVPEGEPGEICLAGEGLFHEYLNCPELNAKKWVCNPFASETPYTRLFRTGDLGRLRPDGQIEYLGRLDRTVKVRGFRVELGGVEAALARHPAVAQCVVTAMQPTDHAGTPLRHHPYIVAFVVLEREKEAEPQGLREFLKNSLPDHAVPAMVLIRDSLPLSPNGKIDSQALLASISIQREVCKHYVPARTPTEARLVQIWESSLKFHPIGVLDNFFEIGGDSLAAIDLILTLEKDFHRSLPITVLFRFPTISALAEVLEGNDDQAVSSGSLVTIRAGGSRPPLFCIHADGSVFIYHRFADNLEAEIPIYGLQAHGLANPKHRPYEHVDDMAAHYIREIRTIQPRGPYHLCAFSAGGLIIFEMARQLHARGEEVAFLGFLDAYGPNYPQYLPGSSVGKYKISLHLNTLRLHGIKGQATYLWKRASHRATLILSRLSVALFLKLHLPMPHRIRYEYIARLIDRAGQNYPSGRTYPGEAIVFYAATQPEGIQHDRSLGWANLVKGPLQVVDVVGTHHSIMMHEPHVADLVRQIDCHLSQLHSEFAPPSMVSAGPSVTNPA